MLRRCLLRLCTGSAVSVTPDTTTVTNTMPPGENTITESQVKFIHPIDNLGLEYQKYLHSVSQVGPYVDSKIKDEPKHEVTLRKRRESTAVRAFTQPYLPLETSFRRLPPGARIPMEGVLRAMYPMQTSLTYSLESAPMVHFNFIEHDEEPTPVQYFKLLPPNYNPEKPHPFMVVIPDFRGLESDFEDVCANWFERPNVYPGLCEGGWVLLCPLVNVKHSVANPIESVVAHFCDWVPKNFNVEGGKVHMFGKGLGGHLALRTCLEYKSVVRSVVAFPGRLSAPFRVAERPFEKACNMQGIHVLIYTPGALFKVEWIYKFKSLLESSEIRPPPRVIHFADIRDHQIYYAVNPYEFWNYMNHFRNAQQVAEIPKWEP